ncbi:hypothetical protein B0O80DRAFT_33107 [Mortierella sp. GBAus27b]|nr:hypothetical protein B0O80DRAFT_33107 [Mortierella sp. GBAus27b]
MSTHDKTLAPFLLSFPDHHFSFLHPSLHHPSHNQVAMSYKTLRIQARHADASEGETFSGSEVYAQFALVFVGEDLYRLTSMKRCNQRTVEWNEILTFKDTDPSRRDLYVDVFQREGSVQKLFGYTTIPLKQVVNSPNASFKGRFDLIDIHEKVKGTISLTISAVDPDKEHLPILTDGPEFKGEILPKDGVHKEEIIKMVNPIDNVVLLQGKSRQALYVHVKQANTIDNTGRVFNTMVNFNLSSEHKSETKYSEYHGDKVEWNSTTVIDNFHPLIHRFLYVKVFGKEKQKWDGIIEDGEDFMRKEEKREKDLIVRYAAIPLDQVANSPDKSLNGVFDLYDEDWELKGAISLTLAILDDSLANERKYESTSLNDHKERVIQDINSALSSNELTSKFIWTRVKRANSIDDGKRERIISALFRLDIDSNYYGMTEFVEYEHNKVEWDEVVMVKNYDYSKNRNLYVEIWAEGRSAMAEIREVPDDGTPWDEIFKAEEQSRIFTLHAAIPLDQVVKAPGYTIAGNFDLYDTNGSPKGTIDLTITAVGPQVSDGRPRVEGLSTVEGGHQEFIMILFPVRDNRDKIHGHHSNANNVKIRDGFLAGGGKDKKLPPS